MRRTLASTTGAALASLALALSACSSPSDSTSSGTPTPAGVEATAQATSAPAEGTAAGNGETGKPSRVDPVAATKEVLAGKRQALIHIAEEDKDWSATYEGPITIGPGTDDGARFRIIPSGNDQFLIEALRAREEGGRWCVTADNGDDSEKLGTVKCAENANTLFRISATGEKDGKGRPTHRISNEKFGTVQVKNDGSDLYIQNVGDGGSRGTYSFVDRGALQ